MKRTELSVRCCLKRLPRYLGVLCVLFVFGTAGGDGAIVPGFLSKDSYETAKWRIYHPDPDHVWNRLHRSFYLRVGLDGHEYGHDELDPLLWSTSNTDF
ncbi:MAG: hypothetical protein ACRD8U_17460 [Pyrinomonadaceae bacterium]